MWSKCNKKEDLFCCGRDLFRVLWDRVNMWEEVDAMWEEGEENWTLEVKGVCGVGGLLWCHVCWTWVICNIR